MSRGDLVQVECQVQRYDPAKTNTWSQWRVTFNLVSVTKLYAAEAGFPVEHESGVEDNDLEEEDASVYASVN